MTSLGQRTVHVHDLTTAPWVPLAGKDRVFQKAVHTDPERGMFFGAVAMEEMTSTGLHRHSGVASSYFLTGNLSDWGSIQRTGDFTVNQTGATHDALALAHTVFVSKLEKPLIYAPDETPFELENAPELAAFVNDDPMTMPDIVIPDVEQRLAPTVWGGVSRKVLFDYTDEPDDFRSCKLQLLPGTRLPHHRVTGLTHWFVIGGEVTVNAKRARGASVVIIEPGTDVDVRSDFGCLLIAWTEGPVTWSDADIAHDLYGFRT